MDSRVKGIIISRKMVIFLLLVFTSFALGDDSIAEMCGRNADVVFVIDSSRSIWPPYFIQQLEFVKHVVQTFDIGINKTRIGALTFSDRTVAEFHLNRYDSKKDILNAISDIHFAAGDETNTFDALRVLRTDFFSEMNGDRFDVPNIVIVLTDGDSSDMNKTVHEANLTRKPGVFIFAIGIGAKINKTELEEIANSPTSDYMHTLENFTELTSDTFLKLLSHTVCNACQRKKVDIMFVLDVSASLLRPGFEIQMSFVKSVVNLFDIDSGMVQAIYMADDYTIPEQHAQKNITEVVVGVITFSKKVETLFRMGQHKTKNATMEALKEVNFQARSTDTAQALLLLRTLFQPGYGSREGVHHIAFVFTDGKSKDPEATLNAAKLVHEDGIDVNAIAVGGKYNIEELQEIASTPSDQHLYLVSDYDALNSIRHSLASKACES